MRKFTPVIAILICFLSTAQMCGSKEEVSPEGISTSCFSKESLNTVAWQKDRLAAFQVPKSGHITAVTYSYKGEEFLYITNVAVSSPISYIFDCSGVSVGKRGVNYNTFMNEAKQGKILFEGDY